MKRIIVSLIIVFLTTSAASSQGKGLWYYKYIAGKKAGQISACTANFDFRNAFFTARLHGEEFDFVYYRDDFTLPFESTLGPVIFRIDKVGFILLATTNPRKLGNISTTAQSLFIESTKTDRADLYNAFRAGKSFIIEFPDGTTYKFPLTGSSRAFGLASDCWSSRPTGPHSNNPFSPKESTNNPFELL